MINDFIYEPFEGILPTPILANLVVAPPYDVLSSNEARKIAKNNPYSFLHISKAEIDFDDNISQYDDKVYLKAGENFRNLLTNSVLHLSSKPCFYIYQISSNTHTQTGLVVSSSVKAYNEWRIKRHELTRPIKENDRIKQIKTVGAQTGPALLINKPINSIKELLQNIITTKNKYLEVTDANGFNHTIWIIDNDNDINLIKNEFAQQNKAYIADGHHRSAAASCIAKEENTEQTSRFLAVTFFEDEMKIMDYNRVVFDLNGLSADEFLIKLKNNFDISITTIQKPTKKQEFTMYLNKTWYKLNYKGAPIGIDAVSKLDVSILSQKILNEILDIKDLRNSDRIDFIGGIRGYKAVEELTNIHSGVGFMLYPTSVEELLEVADNNMLMPPKSTWFEPKLLDGLVSLAPNTVCLKKKCA